MNERERLEAAARHFDPPEGAFERHLARRARSVRRRKGLAAAAVAVVAALAVSISLLVNDDAPAPVSPGQGGARDSDQRVTVEELSIAIPGSYEVELDVDRAIALLSSVDAELDIARQLEKNPETFVLFAETTEPRSEVDQMRRVLLVTRHPFLGALSAFAETHLIDRVRNEGGTILDRGETLIGDVAATQVTGRDPDGNLFVACLSIFDGQGWSIRLSVSTNGLPEGAPAEAASLDEFERMIGLTAFQPT